MRRRRRSGASAIPSVELGRTFPYAARIGFDVSLAIDRMEEYAGAIGTRIKQIDPQGVRHRVRPCRRRQPASSACITSIRRSKHEEFEKLVYGITGEFGGSISAEHGIGILKKPYLKMSRTAEEIETMRTLKRAMDPNNILNPGRIISV